MLFLQQKRIYRPENQLDIWCNICIYSAYRKTDIFFFEGGSQTFRDIYFAKYYGKGWGEWPAGEKKKNQELGGTKKKRGTKKGGKLQ